MKKIETNNQKGFIYSVLLFNDESKFKKSLKSINSFGCRDVLFSGSTSDMMKQDGKIVLGSRISYYENQEWNTGEISSLEGYPYYGIKPDLKPSYRLSIHKRYIKNEVKSTKELADIFILEFEKGKFSHYELGLIKKGNMFYRNPLDSLKNISEKALFIIMLKDVNHR